MLRCFLVAFIFAFPACLVRPAVAVPIIDVGTFNLQPNTPGQLIQLTVSGGDAVGGLNFHVDLGQNTSGPYITNIDILNGTIFAGNNNNATPLPGVPSRAWFASTTTQTGTVSADGILATLTIDTTGYFVGDGPFDLRIDGAVSGTTDFAPILADITNGFITIVPEPSGLLITSAGMMTLVGVLRRKRRQAC